MRHPTRITTQRLIQNAQRFCYQQRPIRIGRISTNRPTTQNRFRTASSYQPNRFLQSRPNTTNPYPSTQNTIRHKAVFDSTKRAFGANSEIPSLPPSSSSSSSSSSVALLATAAIAAALSLTGPYGEERLFPSSAPVTKLEPPSSPSPSSIHHQPNEEECHNDNNDSDDNDDDNDNDEEETETILNWSGTHSITPTKLHSPQTPSELLSLLSYHHTHSLPLRPVGSALSPNGLSFSPHSMLSLSNLDAILNVDTHNRTVRVQAGARVSQVLDELRPYGLTLPNLASIAEQQMGGFLQIGAHGTGALLSPIDEYVTELTLLTPAEGRIILSNRDTNDNGRMFRMARVGLGCLGIVEEMVMECVPAHRLVEHTFTLTRNEAKKQLRTLLESHKHVRYMWIPYEDCVVVVTNDPEETVSKEVLEKALVAEEYERNANSIPTTTTAQDLQEDQQRFAPLRNLLLEANNNYPDGENEERGEVYTLESMEGMGFGALRDAAIAMDPLGVDHVRKVNHAEAEFWRRSEGLRVKPSDELLQFDCGGQQWVYEVCFPTGTYEHNNGHDMKFIEELLSAIETEGIPAHPPIEQRWTAGSSSRMSPAYGKKDDLFCWVGIIMYLPLENEALRSSITNLFQTTYRTLTERVGIPHQTVSHWGKLESPISAPDYVNVREQTRRRYPLEEFQKARKRFDPKGILGNKWTELILEGGLVDNDEDVDAEGKEGGGEGQPRQSSS